MISKEEIENNITQQLDSINLSKSKKRKKRKNVEDNTQIKVISYLKMRYSDVIYKADTSTGAFMTMGMAIKNKKLGGIVTKFPDLCIYHISFKPVLFIELKKPSVKIYKANGDYYKNEHYIKQSESMKLLETKGYACSFGIGFDHCKNLIDAYMKNDRELFDSFKIV